MGKGDLVEMRFSKPYADHWKRMWIQEYREAQKHRNADCSSWIQTLRTSKKLTRGLRHRDSTLQLNTLTLLTMCSVVMLWLLHRRTSFNINSFYSERVQNQNLNTKILNSMSQNT